MSNLIPAEQLAVELRLTEEQLHRKRRAKKWACVKPARGVVLFTPSQVEEIIASLTVRGGGTEPKGKGLTQKSRGR